jgi:hypothetical protein
MTELLPHDNRRVGDRRNAYIHPLGYDTFWLAFEDRGNRSINYQEYKIPSPSVCHDANIDNIKFPDWVPPE